MLNIIRCQWNENINHFEIPLHVYQKGHNWKAVIKKYRQRSGARGTLIHCTCKYKLQLLFKSFSVSYKVWHIFILWLRNSPPTYLTKREKKKGKHIHKRDLCKNVHSSFNYNKQNLEKFQVSTRKDWQIVIYSYNWIRHSNKNFKNTDTCSTMNDWQKYYFEQNLKEIWKTTCCMNAFIWISKRGEVIYGDYN